jgi:hypothetical protein
MVELMYNFEKCINQKKGIFIDYEVNTVRNRKIAYVLTPKKN